MESSLDSALRAFSNRRWADAFDSFALADSEVPMLPGHLEQWGIAAHMLGRAQDEAQQLQRAERQYRDAGDFRAAIRCAFFLGMSSAERGEVATAQGWFGRAADTLAAFGEECPEHGFLMVPDALQYLEGGRADVAHPIFEEIRVLGQRYGVADLTALGLLGCGQSLVRLGRISEGVPQIDQAMVAATSGELSPVITGIVYCASLESCHQTFDLGRAQEWTNALVAWCDSQQALVPFRGFCSIYRAELTELRGEWDLAFQQVEDAERQLAVPPGHPAIALAYYREGELHRLRGNYGEADKSFRGAEEWGHRPEPGRARLRMAQGRHDAAAIAIQHALHEAPDGVSRVPLLAAAVDIFLELNDGSAAKASLDELLTWAEQFRSAWLTAVSERAHGMVLAHEASPSEASRLLRRSLGRWQQLNMPYETATTRVILARTGLMSGDAETADAQLELARSTFEQLGARPDLEKLAANHDRDASRPDGLTAREIEVLRLVATGMTNRAIALNLSISERTVANHVANILSKVGVSSRSAATAYAHRHKLI